MIRVGIVGASGYTGVECVRLLQHHPNVEITALFANRSAGKSTETFFGNVSTLPNIFEEFNPKHPYDIDCLFLALPHTTVHPIMDDMMQHDYKIIDLSADFRLNSAKRYTTYYNQDHLSEQYLTKAVYGIPEYYSRDIESASLVANPGCYAISTILALKPLTDNNIIKQVIVDAKSGVSGAGKTLNESFLYCEANEHLSAYKTNKHRHMAEFEEQCKCPILFSPHLVPMNRGILATCYIETNSTQTVESVRSIYQSQYKNMPFIRTHTNNFKPSTQSVVGSNICDISILDVTKTHIVVTSAIDNLIKGAAGNAIQNLNIMFGQPQDRGLPAIAQRV